MASPPVEVSEPAVVVRRPSVAPRNGRPGRKFHTDAVLTLSELPECPYSPAWMEKAGSSGDVRSSEHLSPPASRSSSFEGPALTIAREVCTTPTTPPSAPATPEVATAAALDGAVRNFRRRQFAKVLVVVDPAPKASDAPQLGQREPCPQVVQPPVLEPLATTAVAEPPLADEAVQPALHEPLARVAVAEPPCADQAVVALAGGGSGATRARSCGAGRPGARVFRSGVKGAVRTVGALPEEEATPTKATLRDIGAQRRSRGGAEGAAQTVGVLPEAEAAPAKATLRDIGKHRRSRSAGGSHLACVRTLSSLPEEGLADHSTGMSRAEHAEFLGLLSCRFRSEPMGFAPPSRRPHQRVVDEDSDNEDAVEDDRFRMALGKR